MATDIKKLAEELVKLTVLEVNELKTILKDEYGIEPVAAVAVAAGGEAAAADEGKSEYDVIFTDKNVNTPLFFRVVAQGIPNTEGGYISVTIPCTTPNYSQSSNTITAGDGLNAQGVLSNVITCKLGCGLIENEQRVTDAYFPEAKLRICWS